MHFARGLDGPCDVLHPGDNFRRRPWLEVEVSLVSNNSRNNCVHSF